MFALTHAPDQIGVALELASRGLSATEIGRLVGIPRATVRDWIAGRVPEIALRPLGSCETCGGARHAFDRLPDSYAYLLGLYLGDGCISRHPRGVFKLRIVLDLAYPGIIAECRQSMQTLLPAGRSTGLVAKKGCVEVYSYWKGWPCALPQDGPGRKHDRPIVLEPWQTAIVNATPMPLLRGLIHSDGCRFTNTGTNWRHPRYSFSNRSDDIRRIFCLACDRLGVRWTECPNTVYVSRKADVARLDEFVGPKA
jgi:hypothetical protein